MPKLLVMRHAKSAWDTGDVDHARPLNSRGRRQALEAADYFLTDGIEVDHVLCSTSVRTRQTLERLLEGGITAHDVTFHDEIYGATAADVMPLLRGLPDEASTVLFLGHWPGVEDLVVDLAVTDQHPGWGRLLEKFVTSAIAVIEFDGSWAELSSQQATLSDFVVPQRR